MTAQTDLFQRAGSFDVVPAKGGGYTLIDTDTFCNWPSSQKWRFASAEEARRYAWLCDDFKCGRRMSIPEPHPDYASE
jgi:hypothetical protein